MTIVQTWPCLGFGGGIVMILPLNELLRIAGIGPATELLGGEQGLGGGHGHTSC